MSIFKYARENPSDRADIGSEPSSSSIFEYSRNLPETEEKTSNISQMKRQVARTGSDVLSEIIGGPGSLLSLPDLISETVTNKKPKYPYEDSLLSKAFPTPEMLRKSYPDYLKPKNESERKESEFIQGTTALFMPGPKQLQKVLGSRTKGMQLVKYLGKRLAKSAGLEAAGELAEEGAKSIGIEEKNAKYLKMGTVFLGSLATENGWKGAEKYKNSLYEEARSLRPQDAKIASKNLFGAATKLKKELEMGGKSASTSKSLEKINEIIEKTKKGKSPLEINELEEFSKKINEAKAGLYTEFQGNKLGRKSAKRNLDRTSGIINDALGEYGKKNKKWYSKFQEAQQTHGAIEGSRKISNWFGRHHKSLTTGTVGSLLAESIYSPSTVLPSIGVGAIGTTIVKGSELVARIIKSPSLRKYYFNVLDGATRNDIQFVRHNLKKLSEEIEKDPSQLED